MTLSIVESWWQTNTPGGRYNLYVVAVRGSWTAIPYYNVLEGLVGDLSS